MSLACKGYVLNAVFAFVFKPCPLKLITCHKQCLIVFYRNIHTLNTRFTSIEDVMGSNTIQAWIFSGFNNFITSEIVRVSVMMSHEYIFLKYMISHVFICILHLLRVYYELTMGPAQSWLDSLGDRALHRYRRGHGLEYRSGPIFFRLNFHNWVLSCVYNCNDQSWVYVSLQFKYANFYVFIYVSES